MSELAPVPAAPRRLRVAVIAVDPLRRVGLESIIRNAGHVLSDGTERADVLLTDGVAPGSGPPTVMLGGSDSDTLGVLPRDASPQQIEAAIRAVAAGLIVRPAGAPRPSFDALPEPEPTQLTPREVEVLAAIGDGLSNKAVARRLGISQHTVKFHVESLFRKLGVASRAEAVHKGLRRRLIEM